MAAYNKPQPHAYPSTNNQLVPFTAPHRQIDPPSRITNHDSYDNDSEINRELPQVDSGELEKKGSQTGSRKTKPRRRKASNKDRFSPNFVRKWTEVRGWGGKIDKKLRASIAIKNDEESEAESLASINESCSENDSSSASAPPKGISSIVEQLRRHVKDDNDRLLLEDLEHQVKEKDRQFNKLIRDLSRVHSADGYNKDDSYFIESVRKLRELIKSWSRRQKFQASHLSAATNELSVLSPYYELYLTNPQNIAGLIQGYVWIQLQDHVFNSHRWADHLGDIFRNLEKQLVSIPSTSKTQVVRFHEWRATTARLIDQKLMDKTPLDGRYANISKNIIQQILGPLVSKDKMNDSKFLVIVRKALELASEIAKQKAAFHFLKFDHSSAFDPDMMDDVNEDDFGDSSEVPRIVHVITAPALVRYGNSNGEGYHIETPILNADVICSPDPIDTISQPHTSRTVKGYF